MDAAEKRYLELLSRSFPTVAKKRPLEVIVSERDS